MADSFLSLGALVFFAVALLVALVVFVVFFLDIVHPLRFVEPTGVANVASLRHVTVITSVPKRHPALFGNIQADSSRRIVLTEKPSPQPPDNHWFDGLVGCAVAASMLGAKLASEGPVKPVRKRYSLAELARQSGRCTITCLSDHHGKTFEVGFRFRHMHTTLRWTLMCDRRAQRTKLKLLKRL